MVRVEGNTIYLYEPIGKYGRDISATEFLEEFEQLQKSYAQIDLRINSPGGNVFDGFTIFNAIKRSSKTVHAHIDGLAASMCSLIPLACDKVFMADNAMYMIHFSRIGGQGGTAKDLEAEAGRLKKIDSVAVDTYLKKSNLSKSEITRMMEAETFLTAKEALKHGFIDEITGEVLQAENAAVMLKSEGFKIDSHKFFKPKNIDMKFDMKFYEALGLSSETTPEAVALKVVEMRATITKLKKEKSEMQKSGIKAVLDAAVNDRRIDENQRSTFQAILEKDYENGVKVPDSLKRPMLLSNFLNQPIGERSNLSTRKKAAKKDAPTDKPRSEWNLMDYRKFDPAALQANPELLDRLTKERVNAK